MLSTSRLRLRRFDEADAGDFGALIADPEVARYIGTGIPRPPEEAIEVISLMNRRYELNGFGQLAVERISDNRLIGRVGYLTWDVGDWTHGHAIAELGDRAEVELGWALMRDAWGSGYATEAASAMRSYALEVLGLRRLISLIQPDNKRSIRVAERLGAVREKEIVTATGAPAVVLVHRPDVHRSPRQSGRV